ncbi:hypothetical protein THF1C08_180067 [Vibrio jasicida]|uniref:Uncharacterized protein n=1 Tax=Vibrio jasicida TaxID=766224 RepID=A0AAU9QIS0_9VIBR|nr:hypothetical protein THF1C08_180067 [Vibrio jasicida]CAH1581610.1 hypothetical protein THF1A12_170067 [Vibrio jasicida]
MGSTPLDSRDVIEASRDEECGIELTENEKRSMPLTLLLAAFLFRTGHPERRVTK